MAAQKNSKAPKKQGPDWRWIFTIFFITVLISAVMSLISTNLLSSATLGVSFVILICIIAIGIVFDIIGVAVTAADEKPFHSMAARVLAMHPGMREIVLTLSMSALAAGLTVGGKACGKSFAIDSSTSVVRTAAMVLHFFHTIPEKLRPKRRR